MFSVSAAFRPFGCSRKGYRSENSKQVCFFARLIAPFCVILSSLISLIARYVPSSTYKSTHENRTKINSTLFLEHPLKRSAELHEQNRCRRRRAVRTLSEAMGLSPRKVVLLFNSESGMVSSSLAIHSSANELLTTFTPVKSRTTHSFCSIIGSSCSRTRFPKGRVPRFSPYSLKLNITIIPSIRYRSRMFRYNVGPHQYGWLPLLPG